MYLTTTYMPKKNITALQVKFNEQSRIRPEAREPLKAFALRIESNRKKLTNYARSLTKNSFDAEDIVQNTIYRAIKNHHKYSEQNLTGWLMHMAYWEFCNMLRDRKTSPVAYVSEIYDTRQAVENMAMDNAKYDDLEDAVLQLEQKDKELADMKFLQGLKYKDIAFLLDLPIGTVKSRVHRIREVLKIELREYKD